MDIAAWLQDLELQRFVSAFRDDDIDGEILSKLTAEDLIGIVVTSVGVAAGHIARPSEARGKGHPGVVTEKRGRGTRYASTPDPTLAKCKPMSAEGRGRRGGVGAADDNPRGGHEPLALPELSRTNADDRLPPASLGRV